MKPGVSIQGFFSFTKKWGLSTEEILITCHLGVEVITTSSWLLAMLVLWGLY
jgi:hypothetical protein